MEPWSGQQPCHRTATAQNALNTDDPDTNTLGHAPIHGPRYCRCWRKSRCVFNIWATLSHATRLQYQARCHQVSFNDEPCGDCSSTCIAACMMACFQMVQATSSSGYKMALRQINAQLSSMLRRCLFSKAVLALSEKGELRMQVPIQTRSSVMTSWSAHCRIAGASPNRSNQLSRALRWSAGSHEC